jgi:hypothetical protein
LLIQSLGILNRNFGERMVGIDSLVDQKDTEKSCTGNVGSPEEVCSLLNYVTKSPMGENRDLVASFSSHRNFGGSLIFITVRSIGDQLRVAVVSRIYRQIERNPFLFRNELSCILPLEFVVEV